MGARARKIIIMTEELCKKLEHYETPEWAVNSILKKEVLTNIVVDPCCGTGVLTDAAKRHGYFTDSVDIYNWGYGETHVADFFSIDFVYPNFSILMNPPFSKACEFVDHSFKIGAKKIVCFQRFAWWESAKRREFWEKRPPARVYICGDRASCWRHDIPKEKRTSGSPTAHAWYVWDKEHIGGTLLGHIYK